MRWLLLLSLVACGSSETLPDGGTDGGATDGKPTDHASSDVIFNVEAGADAGPPVSCPTTAPAAGSACTGVGLCEYGASFWPGCDVVAQCDGATWSVPDNSIECPAAAADGGCPSDDAGLAGTCTSAGWCEYPTEECFCTPGCGGPQMPTAGDSWVCTGEAAQPNCPWPRPRFGSSCTSEGQSCTYELCCGGAAMTCTGGRWEGRIDMFGCP